MVGTNEEWQLAGALWSLRPACVSLLCVAVTQCPRCGDVYRKEADSAHSPGDPSEWHQPLCGPSEVLVVAGVIMVGAREEENTEPDKRLERFWGQAVF